MTSDPWPGGNFRPTPLPPCNSCNTAESLATSLHDCHGSADKHRSQIPAFVMHDSGNFIRKHGSLPAFGLRKDEEKPLLNGCRIKDLFKVIVFSTGNRSFVTLWRSVQLSDALEDSIC